MNQVNKRFNEAKITKPSMAEKMNEHAISNSVDSIESLLASMYSEQELDELIKLTTHPVMFKFLAMMNTDTTKEILDFIEQDIDKSFGL
jgi:hypothetical protein